MGFPLVSLPQKNLHMRSWLDTWICTSLFSAPAGGSHWASDTVTVGWHFKLRFKRLVTCEVHDHFLFLCNFDRCTKMTMCSGLPEEVPDRIFCGANILPGPYPAISRVRAPACHPPASLFAAWSRMKMRNGNSSKMWFNGRLKCLRADQFVCTLVKD
jgi:hypothetical protein